MSGHSKWSKVKHQKATTDLAKAAAFTKASRAITVAVKEGGGITDLNGNFRLRLAIDKAREVNMPKDTIQRAIEKASGEGANAFEQVTYEGYGPGGAAILIEGTTDNRNRTTSQIKNVLERNGGSLARPGAVQFQFTKEYTVSTAELIVKPVVPLTLSDDQTKQLTSLVEQLEFLDDVQKVYTNVMEI